MGLGVEFSRRLRRSNPRADPLVCAAGLLGSAPFLFLSLACARGSIVATYIFIFIGETLLSMNWAIVADILLVSRWVIPGLVQRLMGAEIGGGRPHLP